MSPLDQDSYFGEPELFMSKYDEVHISVAFSWDIEKAKLLKKQWEHIAPVKIGGFAINGEPQNGFVSGRYLRNGVTITSRGCPNRCPWCFVDSPLIELSNIQEGNIIQDNNILACSKLHLDKVFQMLSKQSMVDFRGGLEADRLNDEIVDRLRGLKIYQIWLSYDYVGAEKWLEWCVPKLRKYFRRDQIRCYVLIGYQRNDSFDKAEGRLREAWELGMLPFAMLYRDKKGNYPKPEKEWKKFQRQWTRPAIIKSIIKENQCQN